MPIPDWTAEGILPPIDARDPTSHYRSPYVATLTDAMLRFSTSVARCRILRGYWYSVWSHRRTMSWKGFVQIDLNPASDAEAAELLTAIEKEGARI